MPGDEAVVGDFFKWGKLRKLSGIIYPTTSPYGRPCKLLSCSRFLLIGTESADVLVFTYDQELVAVLKPLADVNGRWGPVSALAISFDHTRVAAGFEFGGVVVWDLRSEAVTMVVPPLTEPPSSGAKLQADETHLIGTPVKFLHFSGRHRTSIVSGDERGVVVMHRPLKALLEKSVKARSSRIVGKYASATHLIGCEVMEGPDMLLVAALSAQALVVVGIEKGTAPQIVLKLPRVDESDDTGCLSYNRLTKSLAYAWGRNLNILRLTGSRKQLFEADRALDNAPGNISACFWIDPSILILQCDCKLIFVRQDTMTVTAQLPISESKFSGIGVVPGSAVLVLGKYEFLFGTLVSWTDRLMGMLNRSKPVEAVKLATQLYNGTDDFATAPGLVGLPQNVASRHKLVKRAIPDLVITSLRFALEHDSGVLDELVPACVTAIVTSSLPMLESLLELFTSQPVTAAKDHALLLLLNTVTAFILHEPHLRHIPPPLFKKLAELHPDHFEQVIYNLDPTSLDLDMAFHICRERHLPDIAAFLSTQMLRDFVRPLEDTELSIKDYLSSALTGRAWPTGEPEPDSEGKNQVYSALFGNTQTLLLKLLNRDADGVLYGLDAGFEDPYLNEHNEAGVSRQLIVDILVHIFEDQRLSTDHLDLFIARNAAKYRQFILLSRSKIHQLLDDLCQSERNDDRENAVLSLISISGVSDLRDMIPKLRQAHYYEAAERLYLKRHDYSELLLMELDRASPKLWIMLDGAMTQSHSSAVRIIREHFAQLCKINAAELAKVCIKHGLDVWSYVGEADPSDQLLFYKTAISIATVAPPPTVGAEYLKLLVELAPDDVIPALQKDLVGSSDVSVPAVVDCLLEHSRQDALALLLSRLGRRSEAMIYIIDNMLETRTITDPYLTIAIDLCRTESAEDHDSGLKLWKRLAHVTLEIDGPISRVLEALAEEEANADTAADLVIVVTDLVNTTSTSWHIAGDLLSNLRLQNILAQAMRKITDSDVFHDAQAVLASRRKGWAVAVNGECEGCGVKVVGVGVDADVLYEAWKARQTDLSQAQKYAKDALVVFACGHSYHLKCIERLGGTRKCLVCT